LGLTDCHSQTLVDEWLKVTRGALYLNSMQIDSENLGSDPTTASSFELFNYNGTVTSFEIQLVTVEKPTDDIMSQDRRRQSLFTVSKSEQAKPLLGKNDVLATIDFSLSSDAVKYAVFEPNMLDWIAFIGGTTLLCFIGGKLVN